MAFGRFMDVVWYDINRVPRKGRRHSYGMYCAMMGTMIYDLCVYFFGGPELTTGEFKAQLAEFHTTEFKWRNQAIILQ